MRVSRNPRRAARCLALGCCLSWLGVGGLARAAQEPPAGAPGGTPSPQQLMMPDVFLAAIRNDVPALKDLLAKGADPNCRNFLQLTPLMLAAVIGHQEMTQALLANGADVNAQSIYGTPLTFAAMTGRGEVAKLLLAKGADPNPGRGDGITVLMLAARAGDVGLARTLIGKGLKVNEQDTDGAAALIYAARAGQLDTARLLIDRGASVDLADSHGRTALMDAAANGYPAVIQLLLDKGASLNTRDQQGRTPLLLAASYSGDRATIQALLKKGADLAARDGKGRTAADMLALRGNLPLVALLRSNGARANEPAIKPPDETTAVLRGLTMIQSSGATFQKAAQCASCHHQGIGLLVTGLARQRGFTIDAALAGQQVERATAEFEAAGPMLQQILQAPEMAKMIPSAEIGDLTPAVDFALAGVAAHGKASTPALAALAVILGRQQFPDGHWQFGMPRVPVQSSYFTMTSLAIRVLKVYGPKEHQAEIQERITKARAWLVATAPKTTEDHAFRLLGLKWSGAEDQECAKAAAGLMDRQRSDGGWGQEDGSRSDAYATGQALYALNQAVDFPTTADGYRRGVNYLLRTQDDDGSWYLPKRAIPANTYMDAGFPHGESQYASYAATVWATMALALSASPPAQ